MQVHLEPEMMSPDQIRHHCFHKNEIAEVYHIYSLHFIVRRAVLRIISHCCYLAIKKMNFNVSLMKV